MDEPTQALDAVAYVDEAGVLGRTSRLRPKHDLQLGLVAAVVLVGDKVSKAADEFAPAFARFKAAAPPGAKLHITDAYAPGNEAWARVADSVREDAYQLVRRLDIPVIFEAQRLRDPRELRDAVAAIYGRAAEGRRSGVEVKPPASKEYVEELLLEMLLEKLEEYGAEFNLSAIELRLDDVAAGTFKSFEQKLEELRSIDDTTEEVTGYYRATDTLRHGQFRIRIEGASAAVKRVVRLEIAGKDDPLVLLVDIVANSLNDYLKQISTEAPVDETSVDGWCLRAAVWPR